MHRSQINGKKDFFPYISFYPSEQYIIKYLPNPKKGILSRGNILCKVRKIHSVVYSLYPYWRDTFWSKKYRNIFQKFKKKPILIQLWKRKIEFEDKNRFLLLTNHKQIIYVISRKLKLNTYGKSLFFNKNTSVQMHDSFILYEFMEWVKTWLYFLLNCN